jgi:hypothetical protein
LKSTAIEQLITGHAMSMTTTAKTRIKGKLLFTGVKTDGKGGCYLKYSSQKYR